MGKDKKGDRMMSRVFVNFPVQDVARATSFYEKLGFQRNEAFSDRTSSAMVWDAHLWIMLHTPAFYKRFERAEALNATPSGTTLISFLLPSAAAVKRLGELAKGNGGKAYAVEEGIPEDQMYGLEVRDPDGNRFEPVWIAGET